MGRPELGLKSSQFAFGWSHTECSCMLQGGYDFLPPGDWADKSARRILIYLGANEGAEMDYVINYNRERQK
jgi:hypothetical protein